jgi:acetyl esterase/lipase
MSSTSQRRSRWNAIAYTALCAAAALGWGSVTFGQNPAPDIKKRLLEQGWGPARQNAQMYDAALQAAPKGGVQVTKDIAYGTNARQKLDIYQIPGKQGLPVMVFFHGGGYTSSARDTSPLVHANVLTYFARNGFLGINADYRLAPEFKWPSGGEDVAAVVRWVKENASKYGGNPDRIFLFGHSAGASHVAQYAFDRRFQPGNGPGIAGAILLSGRYELHSDPDDPSLATGVAEYFGTDPSKFESRSVTSHVTESHVPIMIVMSEFDQLNLATTSGELFVALCRRDGGRCPRFLQLKFHNHGSEFTHLNTPDDYLGKEIIEWTKTGFGATRGLEGSNDREPADPK